MLQDLVGMKRLDNRTVEPGGFGRQGRKLLRELTKGILVLLGPSAVNSHRLLEGRIVRGDEQALLGSDDEDLIACIEMQTVSQILGESGTDGATHLAKRDSADHKYLERLKGRGEA